MSKKLIVQTRSLKNFLELFDAEEVLSELHLGDTWHPSSGFVGEEILNGKCRISEILRSPYDFSGLVLFSCTMNDFKVRLLESMDESKISFEIVGPEYRLRDIINLVIQQNTYTSGRYGYQLETEYD